MSSTPARDDEFEAVDENDLMDYNDDNLLPQTPLMLNTIRRCLQPTAYDDNTSEYLRHLITHVRGTGDWLVETAEYREWHAEDYSSQNVLWIRAVPGAGKSVLAAHHRAQLAATETAPILHFFFRQIIATNRTPVQLVRDWIAQLLPYSPTLQKRLVDDIIDHDQQLDSVGLPQLWQIFCDAVRPLPRVYCFADALDEMSVGHEDFLVRLVDLGKETRCKIFLTSRPVPRIVEQLRSKPLLQISLGTRNMSEDISVYVDHRLEHDILRYIDHRLHASGLQFGDSAVTAAVEQLVRSALRDKSQGSFLYARLIMDNLLEFLRESASKISLTQVRDAVESLPKGLAEMYTSMLHDHSKKTNTSQELQRVVLQWVTHSNRPLRLLELASILDFDDDIVVTRQERNAKSLLRQACGPLLEIMPSDVVGPVHHSFTEYLTTSSYGAGGSDANDNRFPQILPAAAHPEIAKSCLLYLGHVCSLPETSTQSFDQLKLAHPFFDYAISNWAQHIANCDRVGEELLAVLDQSVTRNKMSQNFWIEQFLEAKIQLFSGQRWHDDGRFDVVHLAAWSGLSEYTVHLVDLGYDPEAKGREEHTPLHLAAWAGSTNCVRALLKIGVNNNPSNIYGWTPLHLAVQNNHAEIAQLLLESGVRHDTPKTRQDPGRYCGHGTKGLTPVKCAVDSGHAAAFTVLIAHMEPEELRKVFGLALEKQRSELARLVLADSRFVVNLVASEETPLHIAARFRDLKCMTILLERGALASAVYSRKYVGLSNSTALHAFVKSEQTNVSAEELRLGVEMLINAGCPVDAPEELNSAHSTALSYGLADFAITSALLAGGADPQIVIDCGLNPLHDIQGSDKDAINLWTSHGLDINGRNAKGATPLLHLLRVRRHRYAHLDTIEATWVANLLEAGADPNLAFALGVTPLHLAVSLNGDKKTAVEALIRAGADVNARDSHGATPLMRVRPEDHNILIPIFVNAGADVNAKDASGRTAIFATVILPRFKLSMLKDLIKAGLDLTARDCNGISILHLIFQKSFRKRQGPLKLPEEIKWNFQTVDNHGNTIAHYTAMREKTYSSWWSAVFREDIKFLTGFGAGLTKVNLAGQSPLHHAAAFGNESALSDLALLFPVGINQPDLKGAMPLHLAATRSRLSTVTLLEAGADPTARTSQGATALHFASVARNTGSLSAIISTVRESGSSISQFVNAADRAGKTALHYAARSGVPATVKLLLDNGADPFFMDLHGKTPLHSCSAFPAERALWPVSVPVRHWDNESDDLEDEHDPYDPLLFSSLLQRKGWVEIARGLGQIKTSDPTEHLGIKTCAQHLVNVIIGSIGKSLKMAPSTKFESAPTKNNENDQSIRADSVSTLHEPTPLRPTKSVNELKKIYLGALNDALDARLEPLIHQLLTIVQNDQAGEFSDQYAVVTMFRIKEWQMTRSNQRALIQETVKADWRAAELARTFIEEDNDDLLPDLLDVGLDPFTRSMRNGTTLLNFLARNGRHSALEDVIPRAGGLRASPRGFSSQFWPDNFRENSDLHTDKLKKFGDIFKEPLDGLLTTACAGSEWNMDVVEAIVERIGCSDFEKTLVVAHTCRFAPPHWWHVEMVRYLLGNGANVNAVNPVTGASPLLSACPDGPPENELGLGMVKCLLECGADPNLLDNDERSCLGKAIDSPSTREMLLQYGADVNAGQAWLVREAVVASDVDLIHQLIRLGCDFNQSLESLGSSVKRGLGRQEVIDGGGVHCLHFLMQVRQSHFLSGAAQSKEDGGAKKFDAMVQALLDGGADVYAPTKSDKPFLHLLLESGWRAGPTLDLPGLDLERRDRQNRTLLLASARCSDVRWDFLERQKFYNTLRLLQLGSDVQATDAEGKNVLHHLAENNNYRRGVDLHSILHAVLDRLRQEACFQALLQASDSKGRLPVHIAVSNGNWQTAQMLADRGASFDIPDPAGNTALHHYLAIGRHFDPMMQQRQQERQQQDDFTSSVDCSSPQLSTRDREIANTINSTKSPPLFEPDGQLSVIKYLRLQNLDINALNNAGEPALFNYLRSCPVTGGISLDKDKDRTDNPPGKYVQKLQQMIDAGVNVHLKARDGKSALHVLAMQSPASAAKNALCTKPKERHVRQAWRLLVAAGLDPWAEDEQHRSALDVAAASANTTILELY